ncbi:MAG: cofactor-independent phosphoglycerate mutase [Firmicutes bacterium]|nr:cofactor-independent phosphoglycerate mutase [Bacillota bacterium]
MKYFILLTDGAADYEVEALGGKTPLEAADMKNINAYARKGRVGMVQTVPEGIAPGSDAANLSVMGYDPRVYLTGRSPLEAVSIGIDMNDTDVAFRANIITVEGDGAYEDLIIKDHSSGDIPTEDADVLIKACNEAFETDKIKFYTGVSYRHCMIVHEGSTAYNLTPPHDVLDQKVGDNLPKGEGSEFITEMMKKSYEILDNHPINVARKEKGLNPANTLWIWGQGTKPALTSFEERYGIKGAAISAVDLIKGIAICAGLDSIDVEGATGNKHTNYDGKAKAAIEAYKNGTEFIYMHMEAPDECSHQGDMEGKVECLETIDEKIFAPIVKYLEEEGEDFRVLVIPDHRTPLVLRTHSREPVPFVLYDSTMNLDADENKSFCEKSGQTGLYFANGDELAEFFFTNK